MESKVLKQYKQLKQMEDKKSMSYEGKNQNQFYCQDDNLVESANPQSQENIQINKLYLKQQIDYVKNSEQFQNKKNDKESMTNAKIIYRLQILSLLILVTLSILLITNYDNLLQLQVLRNEHIISSYDNSLTDTMKLRHQFCPDPSNTFHVNCNDNPSNFGSLSNQMIKQISYCRLPILGNSTLVELINRWNKRFPDKKIEIQNIKDKDRKQELLTLLKLYFSGGTYISTSIPYSQIQQRAWRYTLTGYDIVFIDYLYKNEKGIYVPDHKKFMKVKFPYSLQVKRMIDRLLNEEDIIEECQQRQCLIVKSVN